MQTKDVVLKKGITEYWILILLVIVIADFSRMSPIFATMGNLVNLLRSIPILGIATLGVAMLMITGGVDISS